MEEKKKETSLAYSFKQAFTFAWKADKRLICILIFLTALLSVISYLQIASFAKIVDEIILIKTNGLGITRNLILYSALLGLGIFIPSVFGNLINYLNTKFRRKFQTYLELWRVDSFANLDIGTVESSEFQSSLQLANQWGIGSINNVVNRSIRIMGDIVGLLTSAAILWFVEPKLVLLAVISAVPIYFVQRKFGIELYRFYMGRTDEGRIIENRKGHFINPALLVEVLLFNLKKKFRSEISRYSNEMDEKVVGLAKREAIAHSIARTIYVLLFGFAIWIVTRQTLTGVLPVGSLFLAFSAYRGFQGTVEGFFISASEIEEQARYAKRWFDLFTIKPKVSDSDIALAQMWADAPSIEFRNVSFAYPGQTKFILRNISFTVDSGEKIAIVGENGAGKTTLIRLLARVYDPTEGQIFINGVDLKEISLAHWRKSISVLFQDFANYNLTVREAIAITKADEIIEMPAVERAAELSGSDSFIRELPQQYEHMLWQGFREGVALSKGQNQRLAVARILYRDTPIMILDEPTASIDAVTEEKIFNTLETKLEDKTVLLVSHRFSTVKNADKIIVIEHGKILENGSHKELIAKQGRYAELYEMQANRYTEETIVTAS